MIEKNVKKIKDIARGRKFSVIEFFARGHFKFAKHNDEFNDYTHSRSFKINLSHRKFGGVRGRFYEAHKDSLLLGTYFLVPLILLVMVHGRYPRGSAKGNLRGPFVYLLGTLCQK